MVIFYLKELGLSDTLHDLPAELGNLASLQELSLAKPTCLPPRSSASWAV